jgi:hypothetical protein
MTNEEHQQMRDAIERHHQWLLKDKKAAKKYLMELGIWQLSVPIKSRKKSTKPSRSAARKK